MKHSLSLVLSVLFSITLLSACADTTKETVVKVIRDYNNAAIEAYRTGTAKPLLAYADEKEVNKVQILVDLKTSNKLILESKLVTLEVISSTRETDGRYSVRTKERWKYFDRPLRVGAAPGPVFIADIYLEYLLQTAGSNWKIQKVKAEKTEYLQGAPAQGTSADKRNESSKKPQ